MSESVSSKKENRLFVKLNIRIANEAIKKYDIDFNMNTVALTTTTGKIYIFNLQKAIENERILAKKKMDLGVEESLI
jgi:hypothetical protein